MAQVSAPIQPPRTRWVRDPSRAFDREALRTRLLGDGVRFGAWGWIVPLAVALLAGILRFWNLGHPHALIFDETYYVKDAYSLLQSGYERQWPQDANDAFTAGSPAPLDAAAYVVHPPLGKWLIAAGMLVFGTDNGWGWRFSPAFFGTLSVLLLALVAQRMFSSVVLGGLAGMLLAVEGHHLVQSRTALLDVFVMFFALAAFWALVEDRFHGRRLLADRLAAAAAGGTPPASLLLYGPWIPWRPWRLAAGVLLGCALGVKWSSLAFVAVFGLMTVLWDVQARRAAGIRHWFLGAVFREGMPAFLTIVPAAALTYLATWAGWLATSGGYSRDWAASHPPDGWGWAPAWLRSLAEYHRSAYSFHQGLHSDHQWESSPWSWLFAGRPVLFWIETTAQGEPGCHASSCFAVVTDLPNPVIWWSAALALPVVLLFWGGRRDWRAGAALSGLLAGFLPWFAYPERTMFFTYTIAFGPFMVLALTYVLGLAAAGPAPPGRRRAGLLVVGAFVALAVLVSAFFLPVWTGGTLPYDFYRLRIWMPSWG
ncbi:dolichyl-phosphate-mannose--protein mannosyltransferase [Zafaria cholistanensis]|uniref:Polyprenol-phosphate-mannose--protein mannosyltransferase n=1 Tax=Zafaria cholistanensis TaxID=1682741 RepID=A0A5A7NUJ8_9MICC|nr:dolichyl-phosphate-mannose--protein mannosyltransferase [Zafaria cholistanensis]